MKIASTDGKAPQIYAGNKFYDIIMDTMKTTQQAMAVGDYSTWVSVLRQLYNWCSGIVPDVELKKELRRLQSRSDSIRSLSVSDASFRRAAPAKFNELREEIFEVEEVLFTNAKNLLLRIESLEEDSTEFDPLEFRKRSGLS